jgi:alternative ribosome-rescue factor
MEWEIIGVNPIDLIMTKKIKKLKKSNPIAKDLRTPKYKTRVVKPKKGKGSFK